MYHICINRTTHSRQSEKIRGHSYSAFRCAKFDSRLSLAVGVVMVPHRLRGKRACLLERRHRHLVDLFCLLNPAFTSASSNSFCTLLCICRPIRHTSIYHPLLLSSSLPHHLLLLLLLPILRCYTLHCISSGTISSSTANYESISSP